MPPKSRGVLFLNARAGSFSSAEESELRTRAYDAGLRVIEIVPGIDIRSIVRSSLDSGLRSIVVAGGDGSIHHVLQPLAGTDGILGIIPIGTVNHFARDLGIPLDWREALRIATEGEVRQIDTGRVNGIYFLNGVMLGVYPTITEYRERFRSTHSKAAAYVQAIRMGMRQFHHVTLVVDVEGKLETLKAVLFVVSVNTYDLSQAGFVARKTSLDDGRLTVYSLAEMDRRTFVRAASKFMRGKIEEVQGFRRMRTTHVRIDSARDIPVAVDGELQDFTCPLQIVAAPASLLVRGIRDEG